MKLPSCILDMRRSFEDNSHRPRVGMRLPGVLASAVLAPRGGARDPREPTLFPKMEKKCGSPGAPCPPPGNQFSGHIFPGDAHILGIGFLVPPHPKEGHHHHPRGPRGGPGGQILIKFEINFPPGPPPGAPGVVVVALFGVRSPESFAYHGTSWVGLSSRLAR